MPKDQEGETARKQKRVGLTDRAGPRREVETRVHRSRNHRALQFIHDPAFRIGAFGNANQVEFLLGLQLREADFEHTTPLELEDPLALCVIEISAVEVDRAFRVRADSPDLKVRCRRTVGCTPSECFERRLEPAEVARRVRRERDLEDACVRRQGFWKGGPADDGDLLPLRAGDVGTCKHSHH
eukprot:3691138-Rhodomonas_salina.3